MPSPSSHVVLNIRVDARLWARWGRRLAPAVQPLLAPDALARAWPGPRWTPAEFGALRLPLTLLDTFALWRVGAGAPWVLLADEATFARLAPADRAALLLAQAARGRGGVHAPGDLPDLPPADRALVHAAAEGGLVVWWPSLWAALSGEGRDRVLRAFLEDDRLAHRGAEVAPATWRRARRALPGARDLAGTFADESGPNCFGTVLAAHGVPGAAELWLHPAPFERWLADGFDDAGPEALDTPGSVLVWRDGAGRAQHAAVALGDGWALQKEAQGWYAPRQVVALDDLLARWHDDAWTVSVHRRVRDTGNALRAGA